MSQDSSAYRPVEAFDVSDENPSVLVNHLRALAREMRLGFELLALEIKTLRVAIEADRDLRVDNSTRISDIERRLDEPKRKAKK